MSRFSSGTGNSDVIYVHPEVDDPIIALGRAGEKYKGLIGDVYNLLDNLSKADWIGPDNATFNTQTQASRAKLEQLGDVIVNISSNFSSGVESARTTQTNVNRAASNL
jgi:uncharacterized protein YukE